MKRARLLCAPLLCALLPAGCVDQRMTTVAQSPPADLPECSATRALPLPPPAPRTPDQLIAWARRLLSVSLINAANLDDCRERVDRLNVWLSERAAPR